MRYLVATIIYLILLKELFFLYNQFSIFQIELKVITIEEVDIFEGHS